MNIIDRLTRKVKNYFEGDKGKPPSYLVALGVPCYGSLGLPTIV